MNQCIFVLCMDYILFGLEESIWFMYNAFLDVEVGAVYVKTCFVWFLSKEINWSCQSIFNSMKHWTKTQNKNCEFSQDSVCTNVSGIYCFLTLLDLDFFPSRQNRKCILNEGQKTPLLHQTKPIELDQYHTHIVAIAKPK